MAKLTESTVEEAALEWLNELGYAVLHGPEIEPEGPGVTLGEGYERFIAKVTT